MRTASRFGQSARSHSGTCYTAPTTATGAAAPTSCNPETGHLARNLATSSRWRQLYVQHDARLQPGYRDRTRELYCGGDVRILHVETAHGRIQRVKPVFTGYSITDQFKPNDKLN